MTAQATPRHRVSTTTAQMRDLADSVADASVWSMDPAEAGATLVELTRLAAQVSELQARVAAHADTIHVGVEVGASSAANWLAHTTKTTRAAAYGAVRLGHDLEAHASTREALAAGDICAERARVVIRWVDRLPTDLGPETLAKAEAHLLAEARHHDAKALGRLGRRLWEVIAPDEADAHEADILQRQEAAALRACSLTMADDGDGTTRGRFTLPTYHAAALKKMLHALAAPKHLAATQGPGIERRPGPEALGRALCELIERYPTDRLPTTGGVNATVVVVIDEDILTGRLEKAGLLDTGDQISPAMARRLACEAGIIPAVLGSASVPLDLGRRSRYHTEHQRIAMFLRDRGCRAEGCDRTTGLHAHHQTRWTDGGHTNLHDSASLCAWHHTLIHDPTYQTTYLPTGKIRFHRRT
ncbi:HNH endonuclease [Nocardioides sp. LMS-CY]|uniref:HNH endonuclease signature motif containing protein n=1 Tax=Nocardioides sp. (strain LMS-CY) TaxID=2840457 RepID=UPI001C0022F0|nr:HNH endonuclease signature motif containing protein [Nocardioides sp. LMS-CY]QWF23314.1 HNH endonuclease [Nocardioides sp. LMS-CY]